MPVQKEVKKPEQAVTEAEQAMKSLVPKPAPKPPELEPHEQKMAKELDNAYDAVAELGSYAEELGQELPIDVDHEAERLLASLEQTKLKEKEIMGVARYADETEDIEKTIKAAQKAEKEGKHDDAVGLIKTAQAKTVLLGNIISLQRGLAVLGAPSEIIDSVEKSYQFFSKGQTERGNLILQSVNLYMQFPEVYRSNKNYSKNLVDFISQVSGGKKINMEKSMEYFDYISQETIKLANRQALESVVKNDKLYEELAYVNQNSAGELKKQTGELLKKMEEVNKRLSDEKTAGSVTEEELRALHQSASLALNAYGLIGSIGDEYKETQKAMSTFYGNALEASMDGKTKEAELHVFAAQEYLVNSGDKKYRNGVMSVSVKLAGGKISAEDAYESFYEGLSKRAEKLAEKDKELGKFAGSLKPGKISDLVALRQAVLFSEQASANMDKVDEKKAREFLKRGYSALGKGNLNAASAQFELFKYYANTGYKDGIENISRTLQKNPENGMALAGQFLFLMEVNTGLSGALQSSGGSAKQLVQDTLSYNGGMMEKVLSGEQLTEDEQVIVYQVSQITYTMVETTAEMEKERKDEAAEIFGQSINAAKAGESDKAVTLAQDGIMFASLETADQASMTKLTGQVASGELSVSDASFIEGIYQSKTANLADLDKKISYLEGLSKRKTKAEEQLAKEKDPLKKKQLKAKIKNLEKKIKKNESYLKYLKSVRKNTAKFYDMALQFAEKGDYNSASYMANAAQMYAYAKLMPKEARNTEEGKAAVKTAEEIYNAGVKALKEDKPLAVSAKKDAEQLGIELASASNNIFAAELKADSNAVISAAKKKKYLYENADYDFAMQASKNAVEIYSQGQENFEKALKLREQGKDEEAAALLEKAYGQMDYAKKLMMVTAQYNYSVMFMVTENKTAGRADLLSSMKLYYALANDVALDSSGEILIDEQGKPVALDEKTKNIYIEDAQNLYVSGYGDVEGQKAVNKKARGILKGVKNAEQLLAEAAVPTLGSEQREWISEGQKSLKAAKKQAKKGKLKKASHNLAKGTGLAECTKGHSTSYDYQEYLEKDQKEAYKNAGAKVAGIVAPILPNMPVSDTGESTLLVDTADQLGFIPPGLTSFDGEKYREGYGIAADLFMENDIRTGNEVLGSINNDMHQSFGKQYVENHTVPNQKAADLMATLSNNVPSLLSLPEPQTEESPAEKEARFLIDNKLIAEVGPAMQAELDKYSDEFSGIVDIWNQVGLEVVNAEGVMIVVTAEDAIKYENSYISAYQSRANAWEFAMGEVTGAQEVLQAASSANLYSKTKGVFKGASIEALNESADTRIAMGLELLSNSDNLDGYFETNGIEFAEKLYDERQKEYKALGDLALFKDEVTGYSATLATMDTELTLWKAGYSLQWEITETGKVTRNVESFAKVNLDPVADEAKLDVIKEASSKFGMMRSTITSSLIGSGGFWSTMFSDKAQTDLVEGCTAAAINYHNAAEAVIEGKSAKEANKIMAKGDAWFLEHEYEASPMDIAWAAAKTGAAGMALGPLGAFWMGYSSYKNLKAKGKSQSEIEKLQKKFQKTESYGRMARMGSSIIGTGVLFALTPATAGLSGLAAAGIMTMESTAGLAEYHQSTGGWDYMSEGQKALFVFDIGMTVAMAGLPVAGLVIEEAMMGSMVLEEVVMGTAKVPKSVQVAGKLLDWTGKGVLAAGTFRGALDAGHIIDAVESGQMSMAEATMTFGNMTLPMLQMGLHSFRISKTVKRGGAPEYVYRDKFTQFAEGVLLGTPMDDAFAHYMSKEMLTLSEIKYKVSEVEKKGQQLSDLAQYNKYKAEREAVGKPMAVAEEISILGSFVEFSKKNPEATFDGYISQSKIMESNAKVSEKQPVTKVAQLKIPEKEVPAVEELNLPDKVALKKFEKLLEPYGLEGKIDRQKLLDNYSAEKKKNPKLNFEEYVGADLKNKQLDVEKLVEVGALKPAAAEEAIPMLKAVGAEIVAEKPGAPAKKAPAPAVEAGEGKVVGFAPAKKAAPSYEYHSPETVKKLESSFEKIRKAAEKGEVDVETIADYIVDAVYVGKEGAFLKDRENVFMDNLIAELVKLPDEMRGDIDSAVKLAQEKLSAKADKLKNNLPHKMSRDYVSKSIELSSAYNDVKMLDYWFRKDFDEQKANFGLYGKKVKGKSAEAVLFEGVQGSVTKFEKWLYKQEIIGGTLYDYAIKGKSLLDNIVNPTVKKIISKSLEGVRNAVMLMENKVLVDKLFDAEARKAVREKAQSHFENYIEEPSGVKVALVNMDKGFTWLLNAIGNVRSESGLAGSAVGDLGLFIYFEAIRRLDGKYGAMPHKLTSQGDEGLTLFTGENASENAQEYVRLLGEEIKKVSSELGINDSVFKEYLDKFTAEVISTEAVYTYDKETDTYGVKFQPLDEAGKPIKEEKPASLGALLSKLEGQETIGKIRNRAKELRKLNMHKEAEKLEARADYLEGYLDEIVSKLDDLDVPEKVKTIKDAKDLPEDKKIEETVLARIDVDSDLYQALYAMAETNGKGVGHVEEHNVGPSVLNQMGHPVTDYFSALWQKALYESLTEAGIYGTYAEGGVEMYAQGPMAVGLRYDPAKVSPERVAAAKAKAAEKFKGYAEAKDAGVTDVKIYSGKNKDTASLDIAKNVAGFDILPEEYVDMKSIVAALWLDPQGFLKDKFAEPTAVNKKYKSALENMSEGAKWVRTPEDMITYLHSLGIKNPDEVRAVFTELGVVWETKTPAKKPPTPAAPKKPAKVAEELKKEPAEKEEEKTEGPAVIKSKPKVIGPTEIKGKGVRAAKLLKGDALKSVEAVENATGQPVVVMAEDSALGRAMQDPDRQEMFIPVADKNGNPEAIASYTSDTGKKVTVYATKPIVDADNRIYSYLYINIEGDATYMVPAYMSNSSMVWRAAPCEIGGMIIWKGSSKSDNGYMLSSEITTGLFKVLKNNKPVKIDVRAPLVNIGKVAKEGSAENMAGLYPDAKDAVKNVGEGGQADWSAEPEAVKLPESGLYGKDAVMLTVPSKDGEWSYHFIVYKEGGKTKYFLGGAEPGKKAGEGGITAGKGAGGERKVLDSDMNLPGYEYKDNKKALMEDYFVEGGAEKDGYLPIKQEKINEQLEKAGIGADAEYLSKHHEKAVKKPAPKSETTIPVEGPPVIKSKIIMVPDTNAKVQEAMGAEAPAPKAKSKPKAKPKVPSEQEVLKIINGNEKALKQLEQGKPQELAKEFVKIESPEERLAVIEFVKSDEFYESAVGVLSDLDAFIKNRDVMELYGDFDVLVKFYTDMMAESTNPRFPEIYARSEFLKFIGIEMTISADAQDMALFYPEHLDNSDSVVFDLIVNHSHELGGQITKSTMLGGATGSFKITVETETGATKYFFMKMHEAAPEKNGSAAFEKSGVITPEVVIEGSFLELVHKEGVIGMQRDYSPYYVSEDISTKTGVTDGLNYKVEQACEFFDVAKSENADFAEFIMQNYETAVELYGEHWAAAMVTGTLDRHSHNMWLLKLDITDNPPELIAAKKKHYGKAIVEKDGKVYLYTFGGIDLDGGAYYSMKISEDGKPVPEFNPDTPDKLIHGTPSAMLRFFKVEGLVLPTKANMKEFFADGGAFKKGVMKWLNEHKNDAAYKKAITTQFKEYDGNPVGIARKVLSHQKDKPTSTGKFAGEEGTFFVDSENARRKFIAEADRIKYIEGDIEKIMPKQDTDYYLVPLKPGEKEAKNTITVGLEEPKKFNVQEIKEGEPVPENAVVAKRLGENIITKPGAIDTEIIKTGAIACFESLLNLPESGWNELIANTLDSILKDRKLEPLLGKK